MKRLGRRLFISYRRSDAGPRAGRLRDSLAASYGDGSVFIDHASLEGGARYRGVIRTRIAECDVLLVVIGPSWARAASAVGEARLNDEADLVRIEVATAIQLGVKIVPVLVDGPSMPTAADLPTPLHSLLERHAIVISDEQWLDDVRRLTQVIGGRRHRVAVAGVVLIVVLAAALATRWNRQPDLPDGEYACSAGGRALPGCRIDTVGGETRLTFLGLRHVEGELTDRYSGTIRRSTDGLAGTITNEFKAEPSSNAAPSVSLSSLTLTSNAGDTIRGTWTFADRASLPFEMSKRGGR